jgi:hypothetical protein
VTPGLGRIVASACYRPHVCSTPQRMLWNTIINLAGESGAPVIASHALTVDAHAVGVRALLAGGRLWNGHADEIAILPGGRDGDIGCVR